ncbi:MAG: hypothetical protein HKN90_01885, partial [Flavobacteriaceae bacterium]|nr:hypothetical protein [Flavobacteriaceae bacterium]
MDKKQFITLLTSAQREYKNRIPIANFVLQNPDWIQLILERMFDVNDKNSVFSARILELTCKEELMVILPYIDEFVQLIPRLKLDGSIRASAKIIELLCIEYFITFNTIYRDSLKNSHLEQFTESCFDWMITDKAIAIQAHSMYALYLLGFKVDWIHTELIETINKH